MIEEWVPIPGYIGFYEVSSAGRVRSVTRTIKTKTNTQTHKGTVLSPWMIKGGYLSVGLSRNGKRQMVLIHRLVIQAFHGPPPTPIHQVNHRDADKVNNCIDNLEWVTPKQNMEHAAALGLTSIPQVPLGENHPSAKLTANDVRLIRHLYKYRSKEYNFLCLGQRFGVGAGAICRIIHGRTWKHVE